MLVIVMENFTYMEFLKWQDYVADPIYRSINSK